MIAWKGTGRLAKTEGGSWVIDLAEPPEGLDNPFPTTAKDLTSVAGLAKGQARDLMDIGTEIEVAFEYSVGRGQMVLTKAEFPRPAVEEKPAPETPERQRRPSRRVNAYSFLPFRTAAESVDDPGVPHRTAPPDGLLSGEIVLHLEVASPLALFGHEKSVEPTHKTAANGAVQELTDAEIATAMRDGHAHKVVALPRVGEMPYLSGPGLKGVLRSWFEAVTGSARLMAPEAISWRRGGIANRELQRAGLLRRTDAGDLEITPMKFVEVATPPPPGRAGQRPPGYVDDRIRDALLVDPNRVLRNGDSLALDGVKGILHVSAEIAGRRYLAVSWFRPSDDPPIPVDESTRSILALTTGHLKGDRAQQGSGRWPDNDKPQRFVPATGAAVAALIDSRDRGTEPVPVWYETDGGGSLVYVSHVRGGRWASLDPLEGRVAAQLQKTPGLHPADIVFGTAQHGFGDGPRLEWAGRVRVLPGRLTDAAGPPTSRYALPRLETPKPNSAGLYLEHTGNGSSVSWDSGSTRVRGSKVYWHRPGEVTQMPPGVRLKDSRTVEAIEPTPVFEVRVFFEDLDEEQLGALLMACSLRFSVPKEKKKRADKPFKERRYGWKLGLAKPLGFGSVVNSIQEVFLLDEAAAAHNPFKSATRTSQQDWESRWVGPIRDRLKEWGVVADFEALACLDTFSPQDEIEYVGMGEIRREAGGLWSSQPGAAEAAQGAPIIGGGR